MCYLAEGYADWRLPLLPDQVYGWAKLTGEMLAARARDAGVPVTVVRPFSGYGPDQDPSYPFRAFVDRALARADPFDIWGTGHQVRDFVHIDDVTAAALSLAESGVDGPVNIGTGIATSMRDLAELICKAAGHQPAFRPRSDMPAGVAVRVADTTLLREHYLPAVTLANGIADALQVRPALP